MLKYLKFLSSNLVWAVVIVSLALVLILTLSNAPVIQTGQTPEQTPKALEKPASTVAPLLGHPPPPLTPTPTIPGLAPTYVGTPPTATPHPGEIRPPTTSIPTSTPLPVIDLAKGLPDEDKMVYTVKYSDGTRKMFVIPANYLGDKRQLMGLGVQDVIVGSSALVFPVSTPQLTTPELNLATPVLATPIFTPFTSPLPTPTIASQP